ncbi:MAG: hypothetical protein UZ07_CHB004000054 [Chlorobi bacterium OLB7]|nr:MAG: hypothetical protein UZ07_CHB004000054 [Chlorobi bacterium OLB7]
MKELIPLRELRLGQPLARPIRGRLPGQTAESLREFPAVGNRAEHCQHRRLPLLAYNLLHQSLAGP